MKSVPLDSRPREKALANGVECLTNAELLAIILRCGTKEHNVLELAGIIMSKYYNFNNLINCSYKELVGIKGINKVKAIELLAIMEIAKRVQKSKIGNLKSIKDPNDVYEYFSLLIKEEKQEVFMVIFLNIKSHIIKYEKLFVGGVNCSVIDVNIIFKKAIECGASKIICLHNHPSGDPTPSDQDIIVTQKINDVGMILNVKLIDHLIIGRKGYVSLKKEAYF